MRFARAQKVLTFLLAIVAAVPVAISGEVSPVFAVGFAALAAIGWFLEPPLTREPRFRRAIAAAIIAVLALQLARAVAGAPLARVGIEFALALLGIKLASRGNSGDYQQIAILAFLHAIGGTIATFDLSYAVGFALFVVLSPPALALAHLRNEMERRFRHDDRPESRRALGRLLASKRVVSPRFVVATSALSLPVFAITALLFVGFPRFGLGFLGRLPRGLEIGGFTEQVRIGDLDETRRDEAVALRLEPLDDHPDRPARLAFKLRGAAFDTYEGDTWTQSGGRSWRPMRRRGNDYPLTASMVVPDGPGYAVLLEPLEPPYLFVPEGTGLIRTFPVASEGVLRARKLEANHLRVMRYEDEARVGIRYQVFTTDGRVWSGPPPASRASYLVVPAGAERLADLARELAPRGTPAERAATLVGELKRRFRYADRLEEGQDAGRGRTPLDRFLSRGTGTCEHFASALTLMLRAVDIPSRLVTGFASADWNPIGGYYAVRLHSAHAWTEAWIDGRWVTLDATPPAPRTGPLEQPSTVALLIDAIQMRWHKYVVGYDASSQMEVLEQLRRLWAGTGSGQGIPDVPRWVIWTALGAVAALLIGVWIARRFRWRRRAPGAIKRKPTPAAAEATAIYLELERRLRGLGFERSLHLTPKEFARGLGAADPKLSGAARRIVGRYNAVRFGGDRLAGGEAGRLRAEIRDLRVRAEPRA